MPGVVYICSDLASAGEQPAGADSVPVCAGGAGQWIEVDSLLQDSGFWSVQVSQPDFVDLLAATVATLCVAYSIRLVLNVIRSKS